MNHTNFQHMLTLSGNREPVFVPRPIQMQPFTELPSEQRDAVISHKTRFPVATMLMFAFFGLLIGFFFFKPTGINDGKLLLRCLGRGAFFGACSYIPWYIYLRFFRPNPFRYVWFYGKVDDCILCTDSGSFTQVFLSINGVEFPVQRYLVRYLIHRGMDRDVMMEFRKTDWLLGTDVFVVQEEGKVGEKYSTIMVFPQKNNRVTECNIIVIE